MDHHARPEMEPLGVRRGLAVHRPGHHRQAGPIGIDVPSEAFWLALGVVLHAFASALNAQEAGKSEVLTLAEAIMEERKRRP